VTGVIAAKVAESDGDLHLRVKLDGQSEAMLKGGNKSNQHGDLVVELICDPTVTQPDAVAACAFFHATIPHYPAGTRGVVTGSHVLDREPGGMEIHPVTRTTQPQSGGEAWSTDSRS
jgi:hypothetical protein